MKNQLQSFNAGPGSVVLMIAFFLVFPGPGISTAIADNVIISGTTLKVMPGTSVVSSEALVIKSGATLSNAGTVILKKTLANENPTPNSLGNGTVEFSGTAGQSISGQNVFQHLTVNNASGITVGGNTVVNGILTLANGTVSLGSSNLLLGPSATITGTPSSTVMIIATGTGELRKEFPEAYTGSFTFPVGDNTGTPEYSPVTLTFSGGTFAAGNRVGMTLANSKYPDPSITGNYLARYWTITQSGITNFTCNANFQYVAADVTGTESGISCTKVNPVPWVTYGLTNAGAHLLTATGLTGFSSFTGLKSTTPPPNQQLANITIPDGITNCYDATDVLTVAGNGTTFVVDDGGWVTLVAGNRISVLPGARVYQGGYLYGRIGGSYCGAMLNPLVANLLNGEKELLSVPETKSPFIKIYPNPTADFVLLEITPAAAGLQAYVTVYNMNGKPILNHTMTDATKQQISLSGLPAGIYMFLVRTDERTEVAKIVKN
jgi:hypothetical protein